MANNDRIEIKINTVGNTKGADDVAKSFGKIETAADAAGKKISGSQGLGSKMASVFPTFTKGLEGVKNFGTGLIGLAGGPIGIAIAAIGGITAAWKNYQDQQKKVREDLKELSTKLGEFNDGIGGSETPADKAADAIDRYKTALEELREMQSVAFEDFDTATRRTLALAEAQDELAAATIDARVAAGELTEEQGAEAKANLRVGAKEREVKAVAERANLEARAAEAELARIDEMTRTAQAALREAEDALAAARQRQQQFGQRGEQAASIASAIAGGAAPEDIVAMLGGEEAAALRLRNLPGFTGADTAAALDLGASASQVLQGPAQRNALTAQLQAEAARALAAGQRLGSDTGAVGTASAQVASARDALTALDAERAAARGRAAAAATSQQDAMFRQDLLTKYEAPTIRTQAGVIGGTTPTATAAPAVNADALRNLAPSAASQALMQALADGIQQKEVAFLQELLGVLNFQNRGADGGVRAELEKLKAQLADLRARI